jgi:hypothetical protein
VRISAQVLTLLLALALILGAAAGFGARALSDSARRDAWLCQDALARRRQAEQAFVASPPAAGDEQAQVLANVAWTTSRDDAQRLREAAVTDINRFCD